MWISREAHVDQYLGALLSGKICVDLSAPNHKSQIASDLKSRSPNRKNFPQIAVSAGSTRTFSSRAICDLNLCSNRR